MTAQVRQTLFALLAGTTVQRLALFATTVVLARGLELAELGRFGIGVQVGALLALIADSGVRALTARESAAADRDRALAFVHASVRLRLKIAVALYVVYAAVVWLVAPDPLAFWLICGALLLPAVFDLKGIAESLGITRFEVQLEGAASMLYLGAVAAIAATGALDLTVLALALLASRVVYAGIAARWLVRHPVPRGVAVPDGLWRAGGVLSVAQVLHQVVHSSDVILIRCFAGEAAAGLFFAAHKVALAAQIPLGLLGRLFQPHLHHAAAHGDQRGTLERVLRGSAYLILPVAAGGIFVAPALLPQLYGPGFASATWTLRWLLVTSVIIGVGSRFGNLLFARREHSRYLTLIGIGASLNLIGSCLLIPVYGDAGSAFATALATFASATTGYVFLKRRLEFSLLGPLLRPLSLSAAVVGAAAIVSFGPEPVGRIVAGGIVFAVGLVWLEFRRGFLAIGTGLQRSSGFESAMSKPVTTPEPRTEQPGKHATEDECCAVVVHYRCTEDLLQCMDSLREHAPLMPVVVVENGSRDNSAAVLQQQFQHDPSVEVVVSRDNGGFGAGCNLGIARALWRHPKMRHVLLLNPDTVVRPFFLDHLLATAYRHPDAGVIGGRIYAMDGETVWFENGRLRPWTLTRSHVPAPEGRTEFETTFVTGAMMLVDAELLRDRLRFDERYFLYTEDLDLCCEVRARGRTLWINTEAQILHRAGGSQQSDRPVFGDLRAEQLRNMTRGKAFFARKRLSLWQRAAFFLVAFVAKPIAGVFANRSLRFLPVYYRGLIEGLLVPLTSQPGGSR